jgi:hypothetical protein
MQTRSIHPVVAALIAYPFAAWLTMSCMFFAAGADDADHEPSSRNEVIVLAAAPVVLPFLLLLGVLSSGSLEHRQVLEYGAGLIAAWAVCFFLIRFIWTRRRVNPRGCC